MQGLRGRLHLQDRTLVPKLQGRAEALAAMFNAQDVTNTVNLEKQATTVSEIL